VVSPSRIAILGSVVVLACGERLPSLDYEGERVRVGTEIVSQVCEGTLVHIDSELDRVEAELLLERNPDGVDIWITDQATLDEYCQVPGAKGCSIPGDPRRIFLLPDSYELALFHELVHDRVQRTAAGGTIPFFTEGLPRALQRPKCEAVSEGWKPAEPETMLGHWPVPGSTLDLAGELIWWLLATHGPEQVLEFMDEVDTLTDPEAMHAAYFEHFGTHFDEDIYAHWRSTDGPFSGAETGCVALEAPRAEFPPRLLLEATLDCGSPRVRNHFDSPDRVFVEWTVTIDDSNDGWYRLRGEIPEGTELTISPCTCLPTKYSEQPELGLILGEGFDPELGARLDPGVYQIRWHGPLGSTAQLDVEIQAPCDILAQDCGAGQQCVLTFEDTGMCADELPDPGQLGEPCEQDGAPLACAAGLTCAGDLVVDGNAEGVCMATCGYDGAPACADQQICHVLGACTSACDPLAPSCEPGWGCYPEFETGTGGCLPAGDIPLFGACTIFDFECAPGLWCEQNHVVPGCAGVGDGWNLVDGCCTPLCDPDAIEPGCPPELPYCVRKEDGPLGVCGP
jgi:hypothetical protein